MHASGIEESKDAYIWESLGAERFEDGATSEFRNAQPKGNLYEYAIAGTLQLDHLASVGRSRANRAGLERQTAQLSEVLRTSEHDTSTGLDRLLEQHREEWSAFLHSLGPRSFVRKWTAGEAKDVAG